MLIGELLSKLREIESKYGNVEVDFFSGETFESMTTLSENISVDMLACYGANSDRTGIFRFVDVDDPDGEEKLIKRDGKPSEYRVQFSFVEKEG